MLDVYLRNSSKTTCKSESNGRKEKFEKKDDDATFFVKFIRRNDTSIVKGYDGHADLRGGTTGPPTRNSRFFIPQ